MKSHYQKTAVAKIVCKTAWITVFYLTRDFQNLKIQPSLTFFQQQFHREANSVFLPFLFVIHKQ